MIKRELPPGLEYLRHYFEQEKLVWGETKQGTEVVVEALDQGTQEFGFFTFTVLDIQETQNGLSRAYVMLGENNYTFVSADTRQPIILPAGTIMQGGISCQHFPETNGFMSYFGGISVARDYSFEDAMTPDGVIVGGVLVPQVNNIYSFMPTEGEYRLPDEFGDYLEKIKVSKQVETAEADQYEIELNAGITSRLEELFESDDIRREIAEILSTFEVEARYKLAVLLEYSVEDGCKDRYLEVLKKAIQDEFRMMPPGHRGLSFIPSSGRGFTQMIRELGLRVPRPER